MKAVSVFNEKHIYRFYLLYPWSLQEIYVASIYGRDGVCSDAEIMGDKTKPNTGGLRRTQWICVPSSLFLLVDWLSSRLDHWPNLARQFLCPQSSHLVAAECLECFLHSQGYFTLCSLQLHHKASAEEISITGMSRLKPQNSLQNLCPLFSE